MIEKGACIMSNLNAVAREARKHVLRMAYEAKDSHIGCALSSIDILVALYFGVMNVNPLHPDDKRRDRFILSKGHAAAALYAVLAEAGFFPRGVLDDFSKDGSLLANHVEKYLPGVETNGGSGGHGLSLGVGMALAAKADALPYRTFVLMGDGELQEGSAWEAAMFAASRRLGNLTLIVDRNEFQTWSKVEDVVSLGNLSQKFLAFDWDMMTVDGHDIEKLSNVLRSHTERPTAIIARTVKGKGVSFMEEHGGDWHNGLLSEEQYQNALTEVQHA
jgi:transketolase